jgi:hypothetical protein
MDVMAENVAVLGFVNIYVLELGRWGKPFCRVLVIPMMQ